MCSHVGGGWLLPLRRPSCTLPRMLSWMNAGTLSFLSMTHTSTVKLWRCPDILKDTLSEPETEQVTFRLLFSSKDLQCAHTILNMCETGWGIAFTSFFFFLIDNLNTIDNLYCSDIIFGAYLIGFWWLWGCSGFFFFFFNKTFNLMWCDTLNIYWHYLSNKKQFKKNKKSHQKYSVHFQEV